MPQSKVRVVGSGYTTFNYNGKAIAYLDGFTDSGQIGVGGQQGAGWEAVTPLGSKHPIEIVTSRVLGPGTITASIRELWNGPVWQQLAGLGNTANITDVWAALANAQNEVTCQMIIKPPSNAGKTRTKVYHGCVVTGIDDGETVTIGALSVQRNIQIVYTHTTGG